MLIVSIEGVFIECCFAMASLTMKARTKSHSE